MPSHFEPGVEVPLTHGWPIARYLTPAQRAAVLDAAAARARCPLSAALGLPGQANNGTICAALQALAPLGPLEQEQRLAAVAQFLSAYDAHQIGAEHLAAVLGGVE